MEKIIVWGIGQISHVLSYYIQKHTQYKICAYTLDKEYMQDKCEFNGIPIIAFEEIERHFPPNRYKMAVMMGYKNLNRYREEKYLQAKAKGYSFFSYVSPHSTCDAEIGENTFIFNCNDIQPYTKIGNNVVIWANASIGHHVIVEDHCFLTSPKIAGCTVIRKNSFLGNNCTIAHNVEIGAYSIVGAATFVSKNIKEGSVVVAKQTKVLPIKSFEVEGILQ